MIKSNKKSSRLKRERNRLIFYILGCSLPILQFCVLYLGVRINTITLAFKNYELTSDGTYKFVLAGFSNFVDIFKNFSDPQQYLWSAVGNSFLAFLFGIIGIALALLFSYYIMKKYRGSKFFQVVLFLPSIISGVVLISIFRYFMENCVPGVLDYVGLPNKPLNFNYGEPEQIFLSILCYGVFIGFGTNVMLFTGAMTGISDSIFDASKIDGAGPLREFVSIILPMIYGTISTLLVVLIAGIFTNEASLYALYAEAIPYAETRTIGYYLFTLTRTAGLDTTQYPYIAAFGLLISAVTIPLTIFVRTGLKRFGPSIE
jgi:ABC-type sugar transport system permease subunit